MGTTGSTTPSPTTTTRDPQQCGNASISARMNTSGTADARRIPRTTPGWRDALVHLFHTTGTRNPRLRLVHPTSAK